jgi:hypothetical protein
MISSRGLRQVTKHLFFLLQLIQTVPSIIESAEEKEGMAAAVPSVVVTVADQACR